MKKKLIKSAIPIYGVAVLWILLGLICPKMLLKGGFLIGAAVASVATYFGLSKVFPGRMIEVRDAANSGDREIDQMIENGRKQLDSLRETNAALPDPGITAAMDRMVAAGERIFSNLEKDTSKAREVRKFMNYYLPTTEKLMSTYRMLNQERAKGSDIEHAMQSVVNSLDMIASAFEKQSENMYKNRALDIETDIEVLETMLAGDGLIKKNTSDIGPTFTASSKVGLTLDREGATAVAREEGEN